MTTEEVLRLHKTSPHGLTTSEARLRLRRVGFNVLPQPNRFSGIVRWFNQFTDPMIVILLVAFVIAMVFGQLADAGVILAIVLVNAGIGFSQEYTTEQTLTQLRNLVPRIARAWRDQQLVSISRDYVVPGDVIDLTPGDTVPADGYVIVSNDLRVDEAALTGESLPVRKLVAPNRIDPIFMGTTIRNGTGQAVVVATGGLTRFGSLTEQVATTIKDPSPLRGNLERLARRVGVLAVIVFVVVFLYGFLTDADTFEQFFFALALAVAIVPEGLPATISVVLSLAAKRLAKKNALVKRLTTVESLASVTVICTDKTGTLTENHMAVDRVWTAPGRRLSELQRAATSANNAHIDDNPTDDLGDPLEIALARWAAGGPERYLDMQTEEQRLRELPFSEDAQMMSVIVSRSGRYELLAKGAPERIFEKSRLTRALRERTEKQLIEWTHSGYRVLALASRPLTKQLASHDDRQHLERNLTFLGLVALVDPPREDVAEAIAAARGAGIRVMMVTGDNPATAASLARRVGILRSGETTVLTGDDLDLMADDELPTILAKPAVFARVGPDHKLRIVNLLKQLGDTVAVTGDGVNDGPALKRADVGIAMGKVGTDVARQAADIILLDDHFGTLVSAIEQSRLLLHILKKTIFYAFAANSAELFTLFFGALAQLPLLPIQAGQILAVDLGTDILPSFALAADSAHHRLLSEAPHPRQEPLLDSHDLRRLLIFGTVVGLGGLISFWRVLGSSAWAAPSIDLYGRATFAVYATIVLCQIANMFATRSKTVSIFKLSLRDNPLLLVATLVALLILALLIYVPFLQAALHGGPLTAGDWAVSISFALIFILTDELRKWLQRRSA